MTVPFDKAIFTCKNLTSIQLVLGFCHVSLVCNAKMKFIVQTFTIDNVLIACRQRGAQRVLPAEPDATSLNWVIIENARDIFWR